MTPRDSVIMEYSNVPDGTTISSQSCPSCSGGVNNERSMSVGVTDGLLWWRCHRSSCEFKGGHRLADPVHEEPGRPRKKNTQYTYSRTNLPEEVAAMLADMLSVPVSSFEEQGWKYTDDLDGRGKRVIIPVRFADGRMRGYVFRSYWGALPKALTNYITDDRGMAWHRATAHGKRVVIVEDCPSAHRLQCSGVDCVALLGTTLDNDRINEMRRAGFTNLILSLDQDATEQAIRTALELGGMKVVPLDKDVKDMNADEFSAYVERVRNMN